MRTSPTHALACTILLLIFLPRAAVSDQLFADFPGWPSDWQGEPWTRLPPTRADARLQQDYPVKAARFSAGSRTYILRWSDRVTRGLFSVKDELVESGYRLTADPAPNAERGPDWRCIGLAKGIERLRLCEQIHNDAGDKFSDPERWYSQASRFLVEGPWWAVAILEQP